MSHAPMRNRRGEIRSGLPVLSLPFYGSLPALLSKPRMGSLEPELGLRDSPPLPRAAHPWQGERADHAEGGLQPAGARSSENTQPGHPNTMGVNQTWTFTDKERMTRVTPR